MQNHNLLSAPHSWQWGSSEAPSFVWRVEWRSGLFLFILGPPQTNQCDAGPLHDPPLLRPWHGALKDPTVEGRGLGSTCCGSLSECAEGWRVLVWGAYPCGPALKPCSLHPPTPTANRKITFISYITAYPLANGFRVSTWGGSRAAVWEEEECILKLCLTSMLP